MSVPICAMPGCEHIATGRCDDCDGVFCVTHMRSTPPLICDNDRAARVELATQARSQVRTVVYPLAMGTFGILGAAAEWFLANTMMGSHVEGIVIGAALDAGFGLLTCLGYEFEAWMTND